MKAHKKAFKNKPHGWRQKEGENATHGRPKLADMQTRSRKFATVRDFCVRQGTKHAARRPQK